VVDVFEITSLSEELLGNLFLVLVSNKSNVTEEKSNNGSSKQFEVEILLDHIELVVRCHESHEEIMTVDEDLGS